jgi:hypothetical protein
MVRHDASLPEADGGASCTEQPEAGENAEAALVQAMLPAYRLLLRSGTQAPLQAEERGWG